MAFEVLLMTFALVASVETKKHSGGVGSALLFPMKVCPSQRELMKKMASELLPGRMSQKQHPVVLGPSY